MSDLSSSAKQSFKSALVSAKQIVTSELELTESLMMQMASEAPSGIAERLQHIMRRKGKRIRSTLLSLVASSGKKDLERTAHACAGIELLHLASLVHDDIIDKTDIRRGVKTAHEEWGNQIAVLIGDYLLSQAMRCVLSDPDKRTLEILSQAANNLIVGEIQELDNSGNLNLTREKYLNIIHGKTAALSAAAAEIGALIAGFDEKQIEACGKMGADFGIAFQIIDDLLDYGYGAKDLDKAKFTDIGNGLVTLPLIFFLENAEENKKEVMQNWIKNISLDNNAEKIQKTLQESDAFERTKNMALEFLDSAANIAENLPDKTIAENLATMFLSMAERGN